MENACSVCGDKPGLLHREKRIEHYISALAQLEQAVVIYQKSQQDALYRDGLIQRFEFTVELAWKSI